MLPWRNPSNQTRLLLLFALTLLVSFCSIVYELILAQCLSIILGNTILRYSLTIGLYLFSLGMGALFVAWRGTGDKNPELLIRIESALTLLGMVLPFLILGGDQFLRNKLSALGIPLGSTLLWLPSWGFMHFLILLVGLLSGAELPILMDLAQKLGTESSAQKILAIDYLGTFLGALAFPLVIYERLGLIAGSALLGALNALAALLLFYLYPETRKTARLTLYACGLFGATWIILQEASLRQVLVDYVFG